MAIDVRAINYGLILAHQKKIFDIDEDNKRARTAKSIYETVLYEVLAARNWGFAKKRVELSLDGDVPAFGWAHKFGVPGDYLKMIRTKDDYPYAEEDNFILFNQNTLAIQYIFKQEDPNKYTPYFVTTFGTRLAVDFALSIALDAVLSEKLFAVYTNRLATGGSIASQSGGPVEFEVDDWTSARDSDGPGIGRNGQD